MSVTLFVSFVAVPTIALIAFLMTVFFGYKKEWDNYSLKAYLPYEAFERMNPTTRIIARVFYFIYLASLLPFLAFLVKYSSSYNDQLIVFSVLNMIMGVLCVGISVALTYVKAVLPKQHLALAVGHGLVVVVNAFTISSVLNLLRSGNMVSSKYNYFILSAIIAFVLIASFVIAIFVKKDVYSWEYIEKDGKRSFFALALTEWITIFAMYVVYVLSVISIFVVNC